MDESNPYDKLQLTVTLPSNDPHYKLKRGILQEEELSTMQTFDLKRAQPLPPQLLPYLRLVSREGEASTGGGCLAVGVVLKKQRFFFQFRKIFISTNCG